MTREESIQAVFDLKVGYTLELADIEILKRVARIALAAMDSESGCLPLDYLQGHKDGLEWAAQLAEANHPETGDWLYDDPIELAKAIRKGPDMPPAQSVDSEPVAWRYRTTDINGKPNPHWSFSEEASLLGLYQPLYAHPAQPAPVVPEKCPAEIRDLMASHSDALFNDDDAQEIWNACRAAMLAAAPQLPGSETAAVPGKWIPVSEQMPDREVDVQVYCPDKKEQMVAYLERNELEGYFRFATWRTGDGIYCQPTHWMPLPAAPQEVKGE